jgi:hypothetical protein
MYLLFLSNGRQEILECHVTVQAAVKAASVASTSGWTARFEIRTEKAKAELIKLLREPI